MFYYAFIYSFKDKVMNTYIRMYIRNNNGLPIWWGIKKRLGFNCSGPVYTERSLSEINFSRDQFLAGSKSVGI